MILITYLLPRKSVSTCLPRISKLLEILDTWLTRAHLWTFGIAARRFADGLAALRVMAWISKDGLLEMEDLEFRAEIRAPPCLPVAPVMTRRRVIVVSG